MIAATLLRRRIATRLNWTAVKGLHQMSDHRLFWLASVFFLMLPVVPRRLVAQDTPTATSTSIREVGTTKLLFVDSLYVESQDHLAWQLHPPQKTGERLLESEFPWENATLNWFSVLRDGDKYRLWYECYDQPGWPTSDDTSFCYAESNDGVHWTKPSLGLVEYMGSRENNILFRQIGIDQSRSRIHGGCVFLDPQAPATERFKCVSQGLFQGIGERPYYVAGMTSPDGIRWTRIQTPICPVFADSQYSAFWDPVQRTYALYGRTSGRSGRAIGYSTSESFHAFPPLTDHRVLEVNEQFPTHTDLYNPACQPYPDVPGVFLMFPSLFRHQEGTLDIHLAVSRDGSQWTWPAPAQALIPLGTSQEFDAGSLYFGNGGCLPTGDHFSFYFSGSLLKHEEVDLPKLQSPENRRVITRAVAPRDRLVSLAAGRETGQFRTPIIRFAGERLVVNAQVHPGGSLRIGVLDASGNPIPGLSLEDCQPLTVDRLTWEVSWPGHDAELAKWAGRPIRLHGQLQDADLFTVQFTSQSP